MVGHGDRPHVVRLGINVKCLQEGESSVRKRLFKSSRLLHWRLTRSYMLISILAWLLVELLLLLVLGLGIHVSSSFLLTSALKSNANVAGSLLSGDHGPDHTGLTLWIQHTILRRLTKCFLHWHTCCC